ncbi:MAG: helix-turn-helix transcriptional regulator [Promethearchaeota archaeon]
MITLSPKDTITIYRILRLLNEDMLGIAENEWEQEDYGVRFVKRKEIKPLIKKLGTLVPKEEIEKIDKEIMRNKYGGFSYGPDEQVYAVLKKAFDKKRIVEVEYYSPSREEVTQRRISIFYLSRRYIIAYCHKREDIRKFRADRFISAKLMKERYTIPVDFDKKEYL